MYVCILEYPYIFVYIINRYIYIYIYREREPKNEGHLNLHMGCIVFALYVACMHSCISYMIAHTTSAYINIKERTNVVVVD